MTDEAREKSLDQFAEALANVATLACGKEDAFGVLGHAPLLAAMDQGFDHLEATKIILESAEDNYARARAREIKRGGTEGYPNNA